MKIHYFQRYKQKENVATANTMLLLSRFYSYSSDKFFAFLKSQFFDDSFEPEIRFNMQEKNNKSIPDATISQESFKIVVETKITDWFYSEQLINHLESFENERYKVIMTIASEPMEEGKKIEFENALQKYNAEKDFENKIRHKNTTFELLANAIQEYIDDRDYEMQEILDDYLDYCYNDGLIAVSDSWKYLRVQLANTTFDFNISEGVYYDDVNRGFRAHDYLGLYKSKSVRAIGKICAIITAVETEEGKMQYKVEYGDLTEERKEKILKAMVDGDNYDYNLHTVEHRYFFVDKFYETDFKKITPRAPMGSRIFDLTKIINNDDVPNIEELASVLKEKTWA